MRKLEFQIVRHRIVTEVVPMEVYADNTADAIQMLRQHVHWGHFSDYVRMADAPPTVEATAWGEVELRYNESNVDYLHETDSDHVWAKYGKFRMQPAWEDAE